MERNPIVQMKNVTKKIGPKTIIDDLTLDIYRGEVFGFLGPNGAGKTTTIRLMAGLIELTDGDILINGHSIQKNFEKAIAHVGGIIENPEMYKFMSGYDNLVHYARMFPEKISQERIDEVVRLVGMEKRIHEKVKSYSLGMRQRLGLAQALLHSPSLLILDEPTNGLDPAGIREVRNYLRNIAHEQNIAVFVSSHLLSEIQLMCDRVGIIQNGKLISVESVSNLVENREYVAVRIETEPVQKTYELLKQSYPDKKVTITDQAIQMEAKREDLPDINKLLVTNGIAVYEIMSNKGTLEEKFLEMTGGNIDV
ncbi:ABC-2 type transport system ATP-binding protein [Melghiribacillus thermohalophilus]|uniref:ABC-2 type transport system ATP-binding protein n=1 Tax=Melghiribacillus thermohalophilus TaxID=1324956 RepID=A0A4V2V0Q5_9BACI|nr:ABC transporter ATP-binding protein [Melghiribacillus thermohalophilus]TCT17537.1 ABC-2 type transport system ATP-binding protein [Melghiribacillus thermohalophilus]